MNTENLIRKINMECPLCDKVHEIEERSRIAKTIIKGEEINYVENYYVCRNSNKDENEFVTGRMENNNLLNARNEYRKQHGLLTAGEIVGIRERYGLSQVDLAKLLGWGEATISRYESKAIQDEAYDNILRIISYNPLIAMKLLQKNSDQFPMLKKLNIRQKLMACLDEEGREYLQRKALESEYVEYEDLCDANGMTRLDITKLELIISYYADRINKLYKVKLMKMLWYADSLSCKLYGHSMTGLVYRHEGMGALPIGHYKIGGLQNVNMEEEFDNENIKYRFLPNKNLDESLLSDEEKAILDKVIDKFKSYNASQIINYMHNETAYKKTKEKEIIPFSLAKEIRDI